MDVGRCAHKARKTATSEVNTAIAVTCSEERHEVAFCHAEMAHRATPTVMLRQCAGQQREKEYYEGKAGKRAAG
jgi:hypothetical protein